MEQKQKNFKECLAFGEEGEHEAAEFLLTKGVNVLPLYQFQNDHAPFILSMESKVVSPDLICFKEDCFMVEVKTKNQWVVYKGTRETGIDQRLFNHYNTIRNFTGKKVFVMFNHKKNEPLGFYIVELMNYTRVWDGKANGKKVHPEMVFYNIQVLNKLT